MMVHLSQSVCNKLGEHRVKLIDPRHLRIIIKQESRDSF